MSDDHSAGDRRRPYADQGGPEGRHAQTHDVRREQLSNPTGPEPVDESFAAQLAPETPDGIRREQTEQSGTAADDKGLHGRLQGLSSDDLSRLPVLDSGTTLEQGSVYLDLDDLGRGPFKAIGGQEAGPRVVAKKDVDYELWNRLAGRDDDPAIERPAGQA
jgi:hypothetical protein